MKNTIFLFLVLSGLLVGLSSCSEHMADHPRLVLSEKAMEKVLTEGRLAF